MAIIEGKPPGGEEPDSHAVVDERLFFDKDEPTLLALVAESAKRQAEQQITRATGTEE